MKRLAVVIAIAAAACGGRAPETTTTTTEHGVTTQRGLASWYGESQMTASGERFDRHALTAAHRTFRFGTRVRVTNQRNGRSVIVRINDRGPYSHNRIIDLSEAAARELHMVDAGVVPVTLQVIP
ncbi:MAG TPA: septal ring lytic transglycosylase RlpA family protein [Kofleriaceae bacterium]|nr:septal ring lytic transglycosylase RlpA family protein [Kofleriaceae bacterium]